MVADDRRELEVALLEKSFVGLIYFVATQLPQQPQPRLDEPQGGEEVRVHICTTCDCLGESDRKVCDTKPPNPADSMLPRRGEIKR